MHDISIKETNRSTNRRKHCVFGAKWQHVFDYIRLMYQLYFANGNMTDRKKSIHASARAQWLFITRFARNVSAANCEKFASRP